jgi:xanthine phosphoribosyltransferase|tara:strand:- start:5730 stop:6218 length:489 start_codon:yes stop_codon:yes gene_type:complete
MKTINYTWRNVEKGIQNIAMQMYENEWRPDYLIGITRGGLVPSVMLSHMTNIPMHTLCVQLGAEGLDENTESNSWMAEDAYNNKKILIVDDINRGGDALSWIMNDWKEGCHPDDTLTWESVWHDNVKFASILMDPNSIVETDYYYEELDTETENWVTFPWEQ